MAQAVGGGPYLLKEGKEFIDGAAQRFGSLPRLERTARTAIGLTPKKELLLVITDKVPGTTLPQMAQLLKELGCTEGMNLDGGSSTQMVVNQTVVGATIPSGGAVSTALGFVKVAPVPLP
jgi:exopolysaccharide biosynthesis protein